MGTAIPWRQFTMGGHLPIGTLDAPVPGMVLEQERAARAELR